MMHHLYCPVFIDEKCAVAKLYISESYDKVKRFYLTKIEMVPADSTGLNHDNDIVPNSSAGTTVSIADVFEFVKKHNDDFESDSDDPTKFEPKQVNLNLLNNYGRSVRP